MFRTVPLSIIRSFSLYTQQWHTSHSVAESLQAGSGWNCVPFRSCLQAVGIPVWHIPLLCVQWKTPDEGQRNCPKHVEFHSKNKFEKLVHLIGFVIRNLSRCTVTWTSKVSWNVHFHNNYDNNASKYHCYGAGIRLCCFPVLSRASYTKPNRNKHTGCVIIIILTEACILETVRDHPITSSSAFLYNHKN